MEFKDYYAALGVDRNASQDDIRQAYRKLARKYHPDVSKEADAEARFKEVAEAHEALKDPEKRAAYDDLARRHARGQRFEPPPGWNSGYEFSGRGAQPGDPADFSEFFETLFGRTAGARARPRRQVGGDHHAKVQIEVEDAYRGARRTIALRVPVTDSQGRTVMTERQLEVNIPKGVREGQHLRLSGQGEAGHGGEAAGDLYLEIEFAPHAQFRVEGRDVHTRLALAPWEAALGASVDVRMPDGSVQLKVPAGSTAGRRMRLKGKGLPGQPPGDLYVELSVVLPQAESKQAKEAFAAFAKAFPDFDPRGVAVN